MTTITVKASRTYDVVVGKGLLHTAGSNVKTLAPKAKTVMLVSDDTVFGLYGEKVKASLEREGLEVHTFVFPHGEQSKNIHTYIELLNEMAKVHITRTDLAVALGGGVVGDLTGFAASTFLRGIAFVQIPTTLLSMVDASVGGKTAVDLEVGKNLVGAFWQPIGVLCDLDTLSTLPRPIFSDGMAEVIKYAFINDLDLYQKLNDPKTDLEWIVSKCVSDKRDIVEEDERDTGCRQLLNLGHTIGHAVEIASDFSISHGSAVAIGMCMITKAAIARGVCEEHVLPALVSLLESQSLPTTCQFGAEQLTEIALGDKKRTGSTITFVMPTKIGMSELVKVPVEEITTVIQEGM